MAVRCLLSVYSLCFVTFTMVVYFIGVKPLGGIRERLWRRLGQAAMFTNHLQPLKLSSILYFCILHLYLCVCIWNCTHTHVFSDFTFSLSLAFNAIKVWCGCWWISVLNWFGAISWLLVEFSCQLVRWHSNRDTFWEENKNLIVVAGFLSHIFTISINIKIKKNIHKLKRETTAREFGLKSWKLSH